MYKRDMLIGTVPETPEGIDPDEFSRFLEELEDKIDNQLTNPCAYQIFTELENGIFQSDGLKPEMQVPNNPENLNFSEAILNLFNDSNQYDYIVKNGTPNNPDANASTSPTARYNRSTGRFEIFTTINDNYINTATNLSIARTMIHESIHAYIVYYGASDPNGNLYSSLRNYANQCGYIGQDIHHEFMRQYIDGIAYSLSRWDARYGTGGNLGWDYYYAMAFGGLFQVNEYGDIVTSTDAFVDLVPDTAKRQLIADLIKNENDGNQQARGSNCP